ncbi:methyltransferase domain-containing protein [Streptomyces sp. TRM 70351]|uniref:class I SAM-dependent methyltransferase n=1 Tax=Streptomyces sp. TRM 70351 TaxID=3116552 RepID=UPI002E7C3B08|nr:methyltransferase domain-containing protein [Streptomyces sp. TRM 70351]MEE1928486.1 methyltransferase domain-containing protein [Streptomyces sp. TRM 70351]
MSIQKMSGQVRRLSVDDPAYREAFEVFLAGTDEKEVTHACLASVARRLPQRRTYLDVGPADGTTTRHLSRLFERTLCIEPGDHMQEPLRRNCPDALVLREPVQEARVRTPVDLALLSHVLYYLPRPQWLPTLLRVLGWVRPAGQAVVLLQNPDNACMRMVRRFTGTRFDLAELAGELREAGSPLVGETRIETLPVRYRTTSLDEAVTVAEFHLSVPELGPGASLPSRSELADYVRRHFAGPQGGFTMPHAQDLLHVTRPATAPG